MIEIRDWTHHKPDCRRNVVKVPPLHPCSCGLDEALNEVEFDAKMALPEAQERFQRAEKQLDEALRRAEELKAAVRLYLSMPKHRHEARDILWNVLAAQDEGGGE